MGFEPKVQVVATAHHPRTNGGANVRSLSMKNEKEVDREIAGEEEME